MAITVQSPVLPTKLKLLSLPQLSLRLCILSSSSSMSHPAKGHRSHGRLDGASFNLGSKIVVSRFRVGIVEELRLIERNSGLGGLPKYSDYCRLRP